MPTFPPYSARPPEMPVEIPAPVTDYLLRRPSGIGKIEVNSRAPVTAFEQFRGLGYLVLGDGWSGIESWGAWSEGDEAVLYLGNGKATNVASVQRDSLPQIVIDARGSVSQAHRHLTVRFRLGSVAQEFIFAWPELTGAEIRIPVPIELADAEAFRLALEVDSAKSPYEQTVGANPDRRRVGIGIRSIEVQATSGVARPIVLPVTPNLRASSNLQTPSAIAVTMVYNEGDMLRRWISYYGHHLGERSLLVIDHGSDDGSTDNIGSAGRITLPRTPFDDGERAIFVNGLQRDLLRYYDSVIYTDCDEFLVPDPRRFSSLPDYIKTMPAECVRAVGINLIHIRDQEATLRSDRGLLEQRGYGRFYGPECKPAVTRTPVTWQAGFHACDRKTLIDPGILLIHAKLADFSTAVARLAVTREMPWSDRALRSWGAHQRAGDESLIGTFETHERFLRLGGSVDTFCIRDIAERVNAEIEGSSNPLLWPSHVGPLCRMPEWLRGAV